MRRVRFIFCTLSLLATLGHPIYVPSDVVDKKTLNTLGIKTLGWQSNNEHVTIHHNYSKVSGFSKKPPPSSFDQEGETTESAQTTTERIKWQRINDQLTELAAQDFETNQKGENQSEFEQMAQEWQTMGSIDQRRQQQTEHGALLKTINHHLSQFDQFTKDFDLDPNQTTRGINGHDQKPQWSDLDQEESSGSINDHLSGFDQEVQGQKWTNLGGEGRTRVNDQLSGFDQEIQSQKWTNLGGEGITRVNDQLSGFGNHHDQKLQHLNHEQINDQLSGFDQKPQWSNLDQEEGAVSINDHLSGFDQKVQQQNLADQSVQEIQWSNLGTQHQLNYYDGRQFTNAHGGGYQPIKSDRLTQARPNVYVDQPIAYKKCPKHATGQFAYELSCNQFLNCWKGRGYVQNCAPGTLFNPQTSECDFPDKVACISGPRQMPFENREPLSSALQATCPPDFTGIIPHYVDCAKFINCVNGVEFPMSCAPGTLFDVRSNLCDHAYKVECANQESTSDSRFHQGFANQYIMVKPYREGGAEGTYQRQYLTTGSNQRGQTTFNINDHLNEFVRQLEVYGATNQSAYDNRGGEAANQFGSSQTVDSSASDRFGATNTSVGYGTGHFGGISREHGQVGRGSNQFGGGSNQFGSDSNQFHRYGGGSDSSHFDQHGGGSSQLGGGSNQFGSDSSHFHQHGGGSGQLGGGSNQFGATTTNNHGHGDRFDQFGGDSNKFGQSSYNQNQHGDGFNQYGADSNQFGHGTHDQNQHGGGFHQFGRDSNQFGLTTSSQNQHGGGSNQFGSGSEQFGQSAHGQNQHGGRFDQFGSGSNQFGLTTSSSHGQNVGSFDLKKEIRNLGLDSSYCRYHPGFSEHPRNCSLFLFCEGGSNLMIFPCEAGSSFNPTTQACDLNYRCPFGQDYAPSTSRPKCPPNYTGLLPHPTICAKFLNCANGQTFVQDCGPGTVYNPELKACDYPYRVRCVDQLAPERALGHQTDQPKCPQGETGLFPHPTNCSRFLNCANGQTHVQECGRGTVFNPHFKICDYPHRVDCGQKVIGPAVSDQNQNWTSNQNQNSHGSWNQTGAASQNRRWWWFDQPELSGRRDQLGAASNQSQNWWANQNQHHQTQTQGTNQSCLHGGVDQTGASSIQNQNWWAGQNQNNQWQVARANQSSFGAHHRNRSRNWHHQNWYSEQGGSGAKPQTTGQTWPSPDSSFKHSPPPFPSTDTNADYVFEYDDADEVEVPERKRKNFCQIDDFRCSENLCISQSMVCDTYQDCPDGKDEVNCEKYVEQFSSIPGTKMAVREKGKFPNVTLTLCAKYCMESRGFQCKAFNYRKNDGMCFIFDTNVGLSGSLFMLTNYDYYEYRKFTVDCSAKHKCANQKCIDFEQVCDGINDCGDRGDEKGCKAEQLGYSVRLVGSGKPHEGVVEVSAFGRSGYICDDMFGLRDAHVLCKELGFQLGALEVHGNSYFAPQAKPNETFYMMDDVTCLGNESSLRDCDFSGWGAHNCMEQEIIGVVCKTPLEKCPKDYWRCETGNECLPLAFVCDAVDDCEDKSDEGSQYCEAPIELRLVGGRFKVEGRVEIKYHGTWGTICDDDFNDDAAKVVCKYLGHEGAARVKKDGYFGKGEGPIWLDQIYCQGNETAIQDCLHWDWGEHNCEHSEDVGVVCSDSPEYETFQIEAQRNAKLPALPTELFPERCGYRSDDMFLENDEVHFRVVKGSTARKGDYPWQASLRVKGKTKPTHWCGAVVISQRFVLTAAHCLDGFTKGAYIVVAGDYNVDVDEGSEQVVYIEDFYTHEQFRNGTRMNNDIALIKLKGGGFNFTREVQPICLPDTDFDGEKGMNCTISGFGSLQSGKAVASKELRAGWIPIQARDVCKMPHIYGDAVTDGMICAGSLDEGVDACDGDSGGPLACLHNGLFTLVGLTSWGQHCGYANKPGVYVRIAHYRDWIDSTMQRHS